MKISQQLQQLFAPLENCETTTYELCRALETPVTKTFIRTQLEEHPNYPSLLAIEDVLNNLNIATSEHYRSPILDEALINELTVPFIAQIKIESISYFAVVTVIDKYNITYFHPLKKQFVKSTLDDFNKLFTGYFKFVEKTKKSGEDDYTQHLAAEKRVFFTKIASAFALPIIALAACILTFLHYGTSSFAAVIYNILTLFGTIVGALLLWYEIDQHNPALQQICTAGKKTNCGAIVHSKAAKIGGISWSVIGFTYFAGSLISLLVSGIYHLPTLFILSWINVLALPYIIFSVYYQARVAKQWCVLCLAVQVILALQFVTAFFGGFHTSISMSALSATTLFAIILSFILPFLVVSLLLPALRQAKESRQNRMALQRLKHNPQIFEALLDKQKAITESADGLGITIGDSNAKYKLIKVCNPYCGPCAKAHPAMEALVHNNPDVQVQIIFTATGEENDNRTAPVKHLLAVAEKNNEEQTKQALDDWYLAEKKDYEAFAAKYPMNGELKQQDAKISAMRDWCNKTDISVTPTFFVNSYQLPELYSVADLKYFLSV